MDERRHKSSHPKHIEFRATSRQSGDQRSQGGGTNFYTHSRSYLSNKTPHEDSAHKSSTSSPGGGDCNDNKMPNFPKDMPPWFPETGMTPLPKSQASELKIPNPRQQTTWRRNSKLLSLKMERLSDQFDLIDFQHSKSIQVEKCQCDKSKCSFNCQSACRSSFNIALIDSHNIRFQSSTSGRESIAFNSQSDIGITESEWFNADVAIPSEATVSCTSSGSTIGPGTIPSDVAIGIVDESASNETPGQIPGMDMSSITGSKAVTMSIQTFSTPLQNEDQVKPVITEVPDIAVSTKAIPPTRHSLSTICEESSISEETSSTISMVDTNLDFICDQSSSVELPRCRDKDYEWCSGAYIKNQLGFHIDTPQIEQSNDTHSASNTSNQIVSEFENDGPIQSSSAISIEQVEECLAPTPFTVPGTPCKSLRSCSLSSAQGISRTCDWSTIESSTINQIAMLNNDADEIIKRFDQFLDWPGVNGSIGTAKVEIADSEDHLTNHCWDMLSSMNAIEERINSNQVNYNQNGSESNILTTLSRKKSRIPVLRSSRSKGKSKDHSLARYHFNTH